MGSSLSGSRAGTLHFFGRQNLPAIIEPAVRADVVRQTRLMAVRTLDYIRNRYLPARPAQTAART